MSVSGGRGLMPTATEELPSLCCLTGLYLSNRAGPIRALVVGLGTVKRARPVHACYYTDGVGEVPSDGKYSFSRLFSTLGGGAICESSGRPGLRRFLSG